VISTFLPTYFARSRESPSRAYEVPVELIALDVPEVPVELDVVGGTDDGVDELAVELLELGIEAPLPFTASLRMNELLDAVADPDGVVLPLVPVGILLAPFCKQPVRVILSLELALLLLLLVWSFVALCAAPIVTAETHAIAIAALIRFIQPPVCNSHREACKRFAR
jgi:hypothetical protein